jgi:hypothetical protein
LFLDLVDRLYESLCLGRRCLFPLSRRNKQAPARQSKTSAMRAPVLAPATVPGPILSPLRIAVLVGEAEAIGDVVGSATTVCVLTCPLFCEVTDSELVDFSWLFRVVIVVAIGKGGEIVVVDEAGLVVELTLLELTVVEFVVPSGHIRR